MCQPIVDAIVKLWSNINPVASYTSGYTSTLTELFFQTPESLATIAQEITQLSQQVSCITDPSLHATAQAVLINQQTQMDLARASGAGPSGTGAGGVYAAADGIFYITLKSDFNQSWVNNYLSVAAEMVSFETQRWRHAVLTVGEKKECLNTVVYMQGALEALVAANPSLQTTAAAVNQALNQYQALFYSADLASDDFTVYWPALQKGDIAQGPTRAKGYPGTLQNYYTLGLSADQVEQAAANWLQLDLPVTLTMAQTIGASLGLPSSASLQQVWDSLSSKYAQDFTPEVMQAVLAACNNYGKEQIIDFTPQDVVKFSPTPSFLQSLVTGGEDFAINYLSLSPYSQLYLTASKNTSLLTMINILVHEASHGFNFVMSARLASSPLLNLNTSLQVPMTEGQAFYREYQYYAGATALLNKSSLTPAENTYLQLYGSTADAQRAAIEGAALETYIWRAIRYIRALCDVQVNGGKRTYTDFIAWAAQTTGLTEETLHGECFTFMASPGYAPCYALGGAVYAHYCTQGFAQGVSTLEFNTQASAMGFWGWPQDTTQMAQIAKIPVGQPMSSNFPQPGLVKELPGFGVPSQPQLAGHLCVDEQLGDYLFFWFFAAANPSSNTPLVVWLNGGPGASSMLGLFAENGPYKIREDLSLEENPYSWNTNAHYLVIDQPAGTGLSFTDPAKGTQGQIKTEEQATTQLLKGLVQFMHRWPQYSQCPWYIFGESFAGRYIPMLAHAILDYNAQAQNPLPLEGLGIGDGWVAPLVQEATYPDYAYAQGLIDKQQREQARSLYGQCTLAVTQSGPTSSAESDKICNRIEAYIAKAAGGINVYDVRSTGDYHFPLITRYLNQEGVRNALNISSLVGPWQDTSSTVANNLERGEQDSAAHLFPRLFEQLRVLIYNGIYDMDCNFMGTDNWIGTLHWPGGEAFKRETRRPWLYQGQLAGHVRSHGKLTQLLIRNAGHLVPMDQPAVALGMLNTFLNNSPFLPA